MARKAISITQSEFGWLLKVEAVARRMTKGMDLAEVEAFAKSNPSGMGPHMFASAAMKRDLLTALHMIDLARVAAEPQKEEG
ncbi:MAG: hypothetical protein AB1698_15355 [Pseudomonadota bacterium]